MSQFLAQRMMDLDAESPCAVAYGPGKVDVSTIAIDRTAAVRHPGMHQVIWREAPKLSRELCDSEEW